MCLSGGLKKVDRGTKEVCVRQRLTEKGTGGLRGSELKECGVVDGWRN